MKDAANELVGDDIAPELAALPRDIIRHRVINARLDLSLRSLVRPPDEISKVDRVIYAIRREDIDAIRKRSNGLIRERIIDLI